MRYWLPKQSAIDHGVLAANRGIAKSLFYIGLFLLAVSLVSGCTTTRDNSADAPAVKRYKKSSAKYHKVKPGDTLYAVSFKAGVDYKKLAAWNNLPKPYVIYPGQVLKLFPPSTRKKTAVTKSTTRKQSKPTSKSKTTATTSKKAAKPSSSAVYNSKLAWTWPTKGKLVSHFSSKDSLRDGIKIAGKKNQKIVAAESGKIVYVGSGLVGYGRLIIIKHNNKYLSAYGLNDQLLVKEGESVKRGQQIARMGTDNTGKPMLHFEIRRNGKPVNPVSYLPR